MLHKPGSGGAHPSTWEAEAGESLSSRTARATQRNPVSKKKKKERKEGWKFKGTLHDQCILILLPHFSTSVQCWEPKLYYTGPAGSIEIEPYRELESSLSS